MNRSLRDLIIVLLVFGGLWAIFSYFSTTSEKKDLLNLKQEQDIAEYFNQQIFREYDSVAVKLTDSVFQIIFDRLKVGMDTVSYEYNFYLLKNSNVNAFTAFNGNIFVFTGLIEQTESAEELAAVLAHELAHAESKHLIKNLIKEIGLNSLILIISGGDPIVLQEISKMVVSSGFSRKMEREADEVALKYLEKAEINPNRLAQFFLKLKQKNQEIPESLQWIASHPALKERIENVTNLAAKSVQEREIAVDWEAFKKSLMEEN